MCTILITVSGGFLGEGGAEYSKRMFLYTHYHSTCNLGYCANRLYIAENSIDTIRVRLRTLKHPVADGVAGVKEFFFWGGGVNTPCGSGR